MTIHYDEELFALLSGELGHQQTLEVASHLRQCNDCSSELVSVAVAYGSLRATQRVERAMHTSTSDTQNGDQSMCDELGRRRRADPGHCRWRLTLALR